MPFRWLIFVAFVSLTMNSCMTKNHADLILNNGTIYAVDEAFRAMTIWAARAAFEETGKGSLEAWKLADFIITDEDLMSIPGDRIPGIQILYTFLGGEMVYKSDMQ